MRELSQRERLPQDAERNGVRLPGGPIFLLTHLCYLGYCLPSGVVLLLLRLWKTSNGSRPR